MTWNWQQPDWPKFIWRRPVAAAEQQFLVGRGTFVRAIKHLVEEDRNQLMVEAMSREALTTSEIEGEILDRASVQSSMNVIRINNPTIGSSNMRESICSHPILP